MIKFTNFVNSALLLFCFIVFEKAALSQSVNKKINTSFSLFEKDQQLKHAISSLYIIDANTGNIVFDKNSKVGLAPASTQKIITSITAFELLKNDFCYKTAISFDGNIKNDTLFGNLIIVGSGDPTLGSWRWESTKEDSVIVRILQALNTNGIKKIIGNIYLDISAWENNTQNDTWIWQDIGNYYGAGLSSFMWRENQFDIILKSGKNIGDSVVVTGYKPYLYNISYQSLLTSAKAGSGDNAYIYVHPREIRGTIPVSENKFVISGSMQNAPFQFVNTLADSLYKKGFTPSINSKIINVTKNVNQIKIHEEVSPPLDSIIFWLNRKSVNLYGEALLKTIAFEEESFGSTENGIKILKKFWGQNGITPEELNMYDGSGLSPLNRVTTHAQVEMLKYAKSKTWFPSFLNALPEYNNMSMKSGTIRGVKGFCGYHKAKNGKEYLFSFLVNNYNGPSSTLVNKMYRVLDNLK